MMDWISGWLKQLIVIVLLAGFVDLLLPTQSMQRYVKTVIGLFLLLVMMSPVIQLFERKWSAEQLIAAADSKQSAGQSPTIRSLDDIMRDANRMQAANRDNAKQLLETQLAAAIRSGIETQMKRSVEQVSVKTKIDAEGAASVQSVSVTVSGSEPPPKQAAADQPIVRPVKPVIIDLSVPAAAGEAAPAAAAQGKPGNRQADEVRQFVSREWQLQPELITVTVR